MKEWLKKQLSRLGLSHEAEDLEAAPVADDRLSVLMVDDTPANLQILNETLKPLGHRLLAARDGATALTVARRAHPALVLLDVMMPEMDGYEVCRRMKADPELQHAAIIFCSALDDTQAKVKGLQLGAVDFVTKPFEPEEIIARVGTHLAVQQLAMSLKAQNQALRHELEVAREHQQEAMKRLDWALLGASAAVRQVQVAIQAYGKSGATVMMYGAPACGDEAVARAIHGASPRRDRPFISADCSRLTAEEQEALFAPGGGTSSKLALASRGTLYLEHIQQLSPTAQEQLYERLLESANAPQAGADVRFVTYFSRESLAPPEGFMLGLHQFLCQNSLRLPPMAERRDDILPIATEILQRQSRRLGKPATRFDTESSARLREHSWPGNLREIEDVVLRSLDTASGATVSVDSGLLQAGIPLGSYRLLERIGQGGMGEVWKARHQLLARPAAVKLIRGDGPREAEAVERFRREATATSRLACAHTVTLYDFGVGERGEFYYVMELLQGIDLEALAKRFGPLPSPRVAHFLVQACKSLAEAHAAGFVHRDIKPSNLFACRLGLEVDFLKVLDFGLVRQESGAREARLTQDDMVCGTPEYIAPETVTATDQVDGRTDMYSLGASAYQLLTGGPVFEASNPMNLVFKHVSAPPPLITTRAQVPEPLATLVMQCLAKSPQDRPTAAQMWAALEASALPRLWTAADAGEWWSTHLPVTSQ